MGTVFDARKMPVSEWIETRSTFLSFIRLRVREGKRKRESTGEYWISKVFAVLDGCQKNVVLSGRICLDETYFSVAPGNRNVKGNGRLYRGLSQNKICAATATGGTGILLTVCGRAKPSRARMFKAFNGHTKTGSTLIHDGESSHGMLIWAVRGNSRFGRNARTAGQEQSDGAYQLRPPRA